MNQKICIAVLFVTFCLCLTSAVPTYGLSLGLGLGQQYPRSFGFGLSPYAGSIGGIGSVEPNYANGFGSEYGSAYGSYSVSPYNRYNSGYGGGYGGYGGSYGVGGVGGVGNIGGGGGFQY